MFKTAIATALSFAVAIWISSAAQAAPKKSTAVLVDASSLRWVDAEGFPGVHLAVVEGAPDKGPHHMFMKYDAGFSAPMHFHSPDHYVAVVAGTLVLVVDGESHRLPAGSYFSFLNKKPHATRCEAGADCVIFTDVRGKWDVVPVKQ